MTGSKPVRKSHEYIRETFFVVVKQHLLELVGLSGIPKIPQRIDNPYKRHTPTNWLLSISVWKITYSFFLQNLERSLRRLSLCFDFWKFVNLAVDAFSRGTLIFLYRFLKPKKLYTPHTHTSNSLKFKRVNL